MNKALILLYGIAVYIVFLATFLYAIGFIGGIFVPKTIDSGTEISIFTALGINTLLLALFAMQHSIMARSWFKKKIHRIVKPAAERSTYVLMSSLALILIFYFWQPMPMTIFEVRDPILSGLLTALYALGWIIVLYSTVAIDHLDLFGLRQSWFGFKGKKYEPVGFKMPWPYKFIRHPLYLGWIMAFWCTSHMTVGHLFFAVITTLYILMAIRLEERDLLDFHGEDYRRYREKTPMLVPIRLKKRK